MDNKSKKRKKLCAPLRPALLGPVLICLSCVEAASAALVIAALAGRLPTARTMLTLALTAAVICAVTLVLVMRLYRPMGQFDAVMERIAGALSGDAAPHQGGAAGHRMSMASENIEQLFDRYLAAVNREYAGELLARQAQFTTLQSQINPHFLYNTLESLRGHALTEGVTEIADMAEALSHFFRYSISQMGDFVTVSQELDNVRDYFSIQKYRFGSRLNLIVTCDGEDPLDRVYMPKLTLQPIVENSIYHGFDEKTEPGTVTIRVVMMQRSVVIYVRDDGVGMDSQTLESLKRTIEEKETPESPAQHRHRGIALHNVNQRIKMFFGPGYGLYITSTPQVGTDVEIIIPAITEPPELDCAGETP